MFTTVFTFFHGLGIIATILLYMMPTLIAFIMEKDNRWIVLLFNMVMGWFMLGWIISMLISILVRRDLRERGK